MRWNGFLLTGLLIAVSLSGCLGDDKDTDSLDSVLDDCLDTDVAGDAMEALDDAGGDADDDNGTLPTLAVLQARQANETGAEGNESGDAMEGGSDDAMSASDCPGDIPTGPSVAPVAALAMTADDGSLQDGTTFILAGQSVTFSAAASSDADGSVQLAALTVRDSNNTRTVQLFAEGAFADQSLSFPHEGPVNVTLRVLDDDGEVDILEANLYVNTVRTITIPITGPMPTGHSADSCDFPDAGEPLVWQNFMQRGKFLVGEGARWISATMTAGDGQFALCDPTNAALSAASSDAAETDRTVGVLDGSPQYFVFGLATGSADDLSFDVMVHFEP